MTTPIIRKYPPRGKDKKKRKRGTGLYSRLPAVDPLIPITTPISPASGVSESEEKLYEALSRGGAKTEKREAKAKKYSQFKLKIETEKPKEFDTYRCGACREPLDMEYPVCPTCGVSLKWS